MKSKIALLTLGALTAAHAMATDVQTEVKVDSVNTQVATTAKSEKKLKAVTADEDYQKFRFGGYGEMVANFMDYGYNRFNGTSTGNTKEHRSRISIPRFVFAFDYKFTPKWVLGAEIEFEAGGVGFAQELEPTENLEYEYEVEKGGEVALEQFHVTRLIHPFSTSYSYSKFSVGSSSWAKPTPPASNSISAPRVKPPFCLLLGTKRVYLSSVASARAMQASTMKRWRWQV